MAKSSFRPDAATFAGLIGCVSLTAYCMWSTSHRQPTAGGSAFINWDALILVLFGSIFCTLMSVPLPTFRNSWRIARRVLFSKEMQLAKEIETLVGYSTTVRREGKIAGIEKILREDEEKEEIDPFLRKALEMVANQLKAEEIESSLRVELIGMAARHRQGKKFFQVMAVYAPGYGLLTTLIGQVVMLKNMGSDIKSIGAGMGIALLGTLYGSMMSNFVCLPFADKLEMRANEEMLVKQLYVNAAKAMAIESSPLELKEKLLAFLDNATQSKAA